MSHILSFALLALAPAASASTDTEPATSIVHTADLDLRSAQGVLRLQRRVDRAVQRVCRIANPTNPMVLRIGRECVSGTYLRVQPQVASVIQSARQRGQLASAAPITVR
ncbi:UrcA family protein [Sphingomonas sp. MMS12-HWE2-04]|uniref:UrcA family protein n=1 Tax=Sphingomonas sp. MMS12-HWE2-04 TaxID=3234199 RepID=UPI0038507D60